jgi:hypothetical protein
MSRISADEAESTAEDYIRDNWGLDLEADSTATEHEPAIIGDREVPGVWVVELADDDHGVRVEVGAEHGDIQECKWDFAVPPNVSDVEEMRDVVEAIVADATPAQLAKIIAVMDPSQEPEMERDDDPLAALTDEERARIIAVGPIVEVPT